MATDTATPATVPISSPAIALTINAKAIDDATTEKKDNPDCTCGASAPPPPPPKLERKDTAGSIIYSSDEEWQPRGGRNRRRVMPIRQYSISPVRRIRPPPPPTTIMVNSSRDLMSKVGTYDGVADLPFPARSSVYFTTFPFTDKDVKKWAWLMSRGIEDTFLNGPGNDDDEIYPASTRARGNGRNRSPYYEPLRVDVDVPSIYVSRALDAKVIPEDTDKVKYHIVVQNRNRPQGSKLLVAESLKAAGIMIYYEALSGNSVLFVGATVNQKLSKRKQWVRVETLEEAVELNEDEGVVGVIC